MDVNGILAETNKKIYEKNSFCSCNVHFAFCL